MKAGATAIRDPYERTRICPKPPFFYLRKTLRRRGETPPQHKLPFELVQPLSVPELPSSCPKVPLHLLLSHEKSTLSSPLLLASKRRISLGLQSLFHPAFCRECHRLLLFSVRCMPPFSTHLSDPPISTLLTHRSSSSVIPPITQKVLSCVWVPRRGSPVLCLSPILSTSLSPSSLSVLCRPPWSSNIPVV